MEVFKNIVKGAVIFGAVGFLLALAAPHVATLIGQDALGPKAFEIATNLPKIALWEGAFFGTFGAIHAAVAPAFDYLFGGKKKEAAEKAEDKSPRVALVLRQPEITIGQDAACCDKHRSVIEARRVEAAETILRQ